MSLAQSLSLEKIDQNEIRLKAFGIANQIRNVCSPSSIYLFGSAADVNFRRASDIDLLLIFTEHKQLNSSRRSIRSLGLLADQIPVDLLFVTKKHFDAKQDIGGVCYIAYHEGIEL